MRSERGGYKCEKWGLPLSHKVQGGLIRWSVLALMLGSAVGERAGPCASHLVVLIQSNTNLTHLDATIKQHHFAYQLGLQDVNRGRTCALHLCCLESSMGNLPTSCISVVRVIQMMTN